MSIESDIIAKLVTALDANGVITAASTDVRAGMDFSEARSGVALVVRAESCANSNAGAKGAGPLWQAVFSVAALTFVNKDTDGTTREAIHGAARTVLKAQIAAPSGLSGSGYQVDALTWEPGEEAVTEAGMVGRVLRVRAFIQET